jgi:PKD repeat protein
MFIKTTFNKLQVLSVLFLLSITFANAQTSLPYSTDFENGTDGWIDGGSDSQRVTNNGFSPQGNDSWEIKDNSGTASSFYQNFDLADYATVTISFSFQTDSFDDSNDLFEVQLDNNILLTYRYTQDWTINGRVYNATVTLNSSDYTFTNNSRVHFETAGSTGNNDKLYIDEISITGTKLQVAPIANFSADNTTPYTGDVVTFTDASSNNPTSWSWSFSNSANVTYVNGTSSTSQNPEVTFNTAGTYTVTLTATNANGDDTETKTNYIVVSNDTTAPVITLIDSETINLNVGDTYIEFGATAIDNRDGDLTSSIVVAGTVNTANTGTYQVTYNVSDSSGNAATEVIRTVIVSEGPSTLFLEDFEDENQGATNGTDLYGTDWNTTDDSTVNGRFEVRNGNHFEADETDGPAKWVTNPITISGYTNLNLSAYIEFDSGLDDGSGRGNLDYIKFMYKLDGGNPVEIATYNGINTNGDYTWDLINVTGNTIELIIEFQSDNNNNEIHIIDNINLIGDREKPALWKNDITMNDSHNFNPYTANDKFNSNITVSGIGRGNGISGKGRNESYNAEGWDSANFDANDYFEFTLTATPSHEINFESFVFNSVISRRDNISNIEVRSSLDNYTTSIGAANANGATIDLTSPEFQAVSTPITFRIYAWGANAGNTELGIDNFAFYGTISHYALWNGTEWVNNYLPTESYKTVIDADYDTASEGSFSCVELIINAGKTLTVDNKTYVEVENNVTANGALIVETQGAFVQVNDNAIFTGIGKVNKTTPIKKAWYYYTYWGSPVNNMTINEAFPLVPASRRFYFNASNYLDLNRDNFDDNGDDWQIASGGSIMTPGMGYAATSSTSYVFPKSDINTFTGAFNNGVISVPIAYTGDTNSLDHPNLVGNPYASAVDFNEFYSQNSDVIEGVTYYWSQATSANGSGKFSSNDYATFSVGLQGGVAGASGEIPNEFLPSGQGVFVTAKKNGTATFNNSMRVKGQNSNSQFFKSTNTKNKSQNINTNKLWLDLTSNNGVFSEILIGYVDGATNENDGLMYDAPKLESGEAALLYSTIENSTKRFVIQGKNLNSLNTDEVIALGFKTKITDATIYTISIAKLEGDFISTNSIYLEDTLLNKTHNLSASDYSFASEVGAFNTRFKIVFTSKTLSDNEIALEKNNLVIVELGSDNVQFKTNSNLNIKTVTIFDILGREIYNFKGNNNTETYKLTNLNNSIYIAKVALSNGTIITKKAVKR